MTEEGKPAEPVLLAKWRQRCRERGEGGCWCDKGECDLSNLESLGWFTRPTPALPEERAKLVALRLAAAHDEAERNVYAVSAYNAGAPAAVRYWNNLAPTALATPAPLPDEEAVERGVKAAYEAFPMRAISAWLVEQSGVGPDEPISYERSVEMGADHSGLRRIVRAALASIPSTEWGLREEVERVKALLRRLRGQAFLNTATNQGHAELASEIDQLLAAAPGLSGDQP